MTANYIRRKDKGQLHFVRATVAIAVDRDNMVAYNAAGAIVPAADATAVLFAGFSKQQGILDEEIDIGRGWMAFDNDGTTAVTAASVGTIGKVGADAGNISISGNAGILIAVGRIVDLDAEGMVWIDTSDN